MALAAPNQAAQPTCYSTCPPKIDLKETFHVVSPGSEEIEDFSVRVGPDVLGGSTPTGTVTIKAGSKVLCTIILVRGRGSCRPPADALPTDGNYVVRAYYNGDSTYSPATSNPVDLLVAGGSGTD
ncbi:MAG: Ig-like domain-containing protein [Streptosporangiaceae bacterium]